MENLLFLGVPILKHFTVISNIHKNLNAYYEQKQSYQSLVCTKMTFLIHVTFYGENQELLNQHKHYCNNSAMFYRHSVYMRVVY